MIAAWVIVLSAVAALAASVNADPSPKTAIAKIVTTPGATARLHAAAAAHSPRPAAEDAAKSKPAAPEPVSHYVGTSPIAGKGMWLYQLERTAGGDPARIAYLAHQSKLTHIFVRVGSSVVGLKTLWQVAPVIPEAHKYGIKVIAWYFPYFGHLQDDIFRSVATIGASWHGEHFDGFAADIEPAPGSSLNATTVRAYSQAIRAAAPNAYLIAVPPRPTERMKATFPYDAMMPYYDAVAPMVYWGRFGVANTLQPAISYLARWGKPIAPIGQAYDMGSEGGPVGNPPPFETWSFMKIAKANGVVGVSFWDWQEASAPEWRAIRLFPW